MSHTDTTGLPRPQSCLPGPTEEGKGADGQRHDLRRRLALWRRYYRLAVRTGATRPPIIVAWTCADSLVASGADSDRYDTYRAVEDAMSEASWAILDGLGYVVEPLGRYKVPLVVGARPAPDVTERPCDMEDIRDGAGTRWDGSTSSLANLPASDATEPLYGSPLPAMEITPEGRLGRAACGRPYEQLHYPQARTSLDRVISESQK